MSDNPNRAPNAGASIGGCPTNQQNPSGNAPIYGVDPQKRHPLSNYQFSPDEVRVLRECNSESFFQRSLPFGTALGVGTYFSVKSGYLSPNAKYGAVPKVVLSVIIGYFLGKVSYQQKCAEKIMQLPNSKLGEILRKKKEGGSGFSPDQAFGPAGFGLSPFSGSTSTNENVYDDLHLRSSKGSSLDLDTERPSNAGLDDSQRGAFIDMNSQIDLPEPPKKNVSYEELRKMNRDKYYKGIDANNNPSRPLNVDVPVVIRANENKPKEDPLNEPMRPHKKNQYGDVWSS